MNLHEYQAKQLIAKYGISIPKSFVIKSLDELDQSIEPLNTPSYVIKAQIHAGGRGKAGEGKSKRRNLAKWGVRSNHCSGRLVAGQVCGDVK